MLPADAKIFAQHNLSGCRPQANDNLRLDDIDFRLQPRTAGRDLASAGLFVQTPLCREVPI